MTSPTSERRDKTKVVYWILRMIFMFLLAYYFLVVGSMIAGKTSLWTPLWIFQLSRETDGAIGAWIFAAGMFVGEIGWAVACFFSGLIIGAILVKDGMRWGLGVAFSVHLFRLGLLWSLMRQEQFTYPRNLLLTMSVIYLLILFISCISGAIGGYCGQKATGAVLSKWFHRDPSGTAHSS